MDDDNSRNLDIFEFKKAARDYRFDLTDIEVEKAFLAFDLHGTGRIDYEDFLRTIRGSMNNFRRKFVEQAFNIMDKDKSGSIDINDIKGVYNAKFHPEVRQGKKSEEEVLLEFLETFEHHHNLHAGEAADHIVSKEEWYEYYENVSMSVDDDAYFELMMTNCWRLANATTNNNEKRGWALKEENPNKNQTVQESYKQKFGEQRKVNNEPEQPKSLGNPLLDKFRDRLLARGGRGIIGLARQFKIFDDNNSKTLEFEEFNKAIRDFKIELSPNEIKVVFGLFDRDGSGSIDYEEFLRTVRGEMNERRKALALQAFNKLDRDSSGIIDINDIKYVYSVKNHPDVRSKKKTEEEAYGEFLETFETHHNINKGPRDRRVTKEEWVEYYNNISMSIDTDDYFEQMMVSAWRLGPQVEIKPAWKSTDKENFLPKYAHREGKDAPVFRNGPFATTTEPTTYFNADKPNANSIVNNFSKVGDETILKLREKLASRGTRGIFGIRRNFKIADDDNSRSIDFDEFAKLIKDFRIALNELEVKKLFSIFDTDKSGRIDYEEFLYGVVGEMNDFRKEFVKKVFKKFDKDGSGVVDLNDLRGVYNARNHPDVRSGRRTEDEVLAEFLDTFEYHFSFLVKISF
jgi:Ca2+-binding EF-hand superfamily protein